MTYAHCGAGAEVTLCTVTLGGHTWPGGLPVPALGYTTPWLDATDAMWDFFEKHPMP
jgi:polyhydroxybutyrate depolymerase